MLFSGLPFLLYFLPVTLVLYYIAPKRARNGILLIMSLIFYGWGEPKYLILMFAAVIVGYFSGILIGKYRRKIILASSLIFNILLLGFFKYYDFIADNLNAAAGLSLPLFSLALPIGISFYSFQLMSYSVDVYRGDLPPLKNFIDFAAYITNFAQLIAGPIVRLKDVANELRDRVYSADGMYSGARRFLIGLGKKVLLANGLGELSAKCRAGEDSVLTLWLAAIAFMLQIYYDFSGYSDMAIGLGSLFGFHFPENFNYPYISRSVSEFWRRWHITLGGWFRDYVYIPLGGSRREKPMLLFNITLVWLLTGLWHGAAWSFIVWGLWSAVFIIAEKLFLAPLLERAKVFSHIYLLFSVLLGFVIFDAENLSAAWNTLGGLFGAGGLAVSTAEGIYFLKSYFVLLVISSIGATPLPARLFDRLTAKFPSAVLAEGALLTGIFILSTAYLADGSFNPFLYFRF